MADALAHSAKEGKPLLVEFYSDSCPWCRRLSWVTYPDREVDELLRRLSLVRLNSVLDRSGTVKELGLRGTPKCVVFDARGRMLHRIDGWMPPAPFVEHLRRALEAAPGSVR